MSEAPKELYFYDDWLAQHTEGKMLCGNNRYLHENHVDALLKAEREKALREAAAIAPKSIRNYGMMKPGKPDQFASREAQIVAKGFARLIEEDILALISEDATDG